MVKYLAVDPITLNLEDKLEVVFDLLEEGDRKQAKYHLKKIARKYPSHYLTLYAQGMLAAFIDKTEIAEKFLLRSIGQNPNYALAHYNLANSYRQTKKFDAVVKHSALALELATPEEIELMGPAQQLIDTVQETLAVNVTIKDYIEDAEIFQQAIMHMGKSEFRQAMTLFNRVISHQPKHVQARSNLGNCYVMLGEYDKARDLFQQALALDPDYQMAKNNIELLQQLESGELSEPKGVVILNSEYV